MHMRHWRPHQNAESEAGPDKRVCIPNRVPDLTNIVERSGQCPLFVCFERTMDSFGPRAFPQEYNMQQDVTCARRVSSQLWQSCVETLWTATFWAPCGLVVLGPEAETFVMTLNLSFLLLLITDELPQEALGHKKGE